MEALKAEIALKRKALQDDSSRPSKYLKKSDLEKLREEKERQEKEAKAERERAEEEQKERAKASANAQVSLYWYCVLLLRSSFGMENRVVHFLSLSLLSLTARLPVLRILLQPPVSTSRMKRLFVACGLKANLFVYLENQTRIDGSVFVL